MAEMTAMCGCGEQIVRIDHVWRRVGRETNTPFCRANSSGLHHPVSAPQAQPEEDEVYVWEHDHNKGTLYGGNSTPQPLLDNYRILEEVARQYAKDLQRLTALCEYLMPSHGMDNRDAEDWMEGQYLPATDRENDFQDRKLRATAVVMERKKAEASRG